MSFAVSAYSGDAGAFTRNHGGFGMRGALAFKFSTLDMARYRFSDTSKMDCPIKGVKNRLVHHFRQGWVGEHRVH